tara:strand:- start:12 stop:302 length:291 start_codon:yes stop_codon:yes gene_type:complete
MRTVFKSGAGCTPEFESVELEQAVNAIAPDMITAIKRNISTPSRWHYPDQVLWVSSGYCPLSLPIPQAPQGLARLARHLVSANAAHRPGFCSKVLL